MTEIFVYGLCDVYYDAFYIKGLKEFYRIKNIYFNCSRFPKFHQGTFAAIVVQDGKEFRICIDSRDQADLWTDALHWCHVYGKVNYNVINIPESHANKVVAIGPSFGIKIWSFPKTIFLALVNFIRFRKQIPRSKLFLSNYLAQSKRESLVNYYTKEKNNPQAKKYIFFASTLWKNEKETNSFRANFINACRENEEIEFEGGFVPRSDGNNLGFDSLVTDAIYTMPQYLKKIRKSAIVFNTPAVLHCHGWKLGEFLAMGKAILSTSFYNEMPVELIDGKELIFLENAGEKEISDKLQELMRSEKQQLHLRQNSERYFQEHLHPQKVLERVNERHIANSIK